MAQKSEDLILMKVIQIIATVHIKLRKKPLSCKTSKKCVLISAHLPNQAKIVSIDVTFSIRTPHQLSFKKMLTLHKKTTLTWQIFVSLPHHMSDPEIHSHFTQTATGLIAMESATKTNKRIEAGKKRKKRERVK